MGYLPVSNPTAHRTPLPLALGGLGYIWIVAGPAWCGSRLMSRARTCNPDRSNASLVFYTFIGFCVFDLVIESIILRKGMFIYPSTIPSLTLFAGTRRQLPIYETLSWAGTYTVLASLHFLRNDKGETMADRDFDRIAIPAPRSIPR